MSIASAIGTAAEARRSTMDPRLGYEDARWARLTACEITEAAHLIGPAPLSGILLKVGRIDQAAIIMSRASNY